MKSRTATYLVWSCLALATATGGAGVSVAASAPQLAQAPATDVTDAVTLLERESPNDQALNAKQAELAGAQPPSDLDAADLARFLVRRGAAAGLVGRNRQKLEDLREAARQAVDAGGMGEIERTWVRWRYGEALLAGGSPAAALEHFSSILDDIPLNTEPQSMEEGWLQGHSIAWRGLLAMAQAAAGDIDAAEETLADVDTLYTATRMWPVGDQEHRIFDQSYASARAGFLDLSGRHAEAEKFHRQTLKAMAPWREWSLWEGVDAESLERLEQLRQAALAENLRLQGRLLEAETEARIVLAAALKSLGRRSTHTISIVDGLNRILFSQGRHEDSEELAGAAVTALQRAGVASESIYMVQARLTRAESLVALGQWKDALAVYQRIETDLASDPQTFRRLVGNKLGRGLALLKSGALEKARSVIGDTVEARRRLYGDQHRATLEAQSILALTEAALGRSQPALDSLRKTVSALLAMKDEGEGRSDDTAESRRLRVIIEGYMALLAEAGDAVEAFRLADVARSASVQRAVSSSASRAAVRDPDLAELVRREQDAGQQIEALYGLLNTVLEGAGGAPDSTVEELRSRIGELKTARKGLRGEIRERYPDYAALINPRPATLEEAQTSLRPGEALIATYVGEERSFVWAVGPAGPAAFAVVDTADAALGDTVALLRSALDPGVTELADIPVFDLGAAHGVYRAFLEPVEEAWGDAKDLIVVADGPLGYLPFSVLPRRAATLEPLAGAPFEAYRKVPWLVRSHAITVVPSVTSLVTLRKLPPPPAERKPFSGFGDPLFNAEQAAAETASAADSVAVATRGVLRLRAAPARDGKSAVGLGRLPRLPDTATEVRAMASALAGSPDRGVHLGREANEETVKTADLSEYRVIAFATHGLIPGDLGGLTQPALALTAPEVAGVEGDGVLTMEEILSLKLNADLVVLSACNTGSGEGAGAEAVSGLGRAFFYAGTRALLVSNWPVETTSAKTLTTDFFRRLKETPDGGQAQVMRQAVLGLIDGPGYTEPGSGKTLYSYAHPLFWAPFSLVGEGGTAAAE